MYWDESFQAYNDLAFIAAYTTKTPSSDKLRQSYEGGVYSAEFASGQISI